jgi:hypothetical protein
MRKKIKHPLTTRAAKAIIKELMRLSDLTRVDPNDILEQSTRNDWRDVYELKSKGANGTGPPPTGTAKTAGNWALVEAAKREHEQKYGGQHD